MDSLRGPETNKPERRGQKRKLAQGGAIGSVERMGNLWGGISDGVWATTRDARNPPDPSYLSLLRVRLPEGAFLREPAMSAIH